MEDFKIQKLTEEYVNDVALLEESLIGKTSVDSIRKTIDSATLDYYLLFVGDELVGFFEMSVVEPEAELFDVAVKVEHQGKGYGKILMKEFLNQVKHKKCETVFLEVNSINNKAINLYRQFGFCEYDKRKNYYGENDAILMKLDLN